MTKEEYLQNQWDSIDRMPIEKLREYTKRLDASAQAYFHNWQEAVQEVNRLSTIVQQPINESKPSLIGKRCVKLDAGVGNEM